MTKAASSRPRKPVPAAPDLAADPAITAIAATPPVAEPAKAPADSAAPTRLFNPIKGSDVRGGHLMAIVQYVGVLGLEQGYGMVARLRDLDTGLEWERRGVELIERMLSADQSTQTVEVTRTEMAELLTTSFNRPFTVNFLKQEGKSRASGEGEERTLRGRLIQPEPLMGRSMVEDLDIPAGQHRIRQVDHRHLQWLVVDGVRYILKKR